MSVRDNRESGKVSRQGWNVGKSERDDVAITKEQSIFQIGLVFAYERTTVMRCVNARHLFLGSRERTYRGTPISHQRRVSL